MSDAPLPRASAPAPQVALTRSRPLSHALEPHYPALRALRTRQELHQSALYAQIRPELDRILNGIERGEPDPATQRPPRPGAPLRVVAWNIQRGSRLDALRQALREDPVLSGADVLLLSEVDLGMGRSGNRNVARELAEALGMYYAFGVSYLALGDDFYENPDRAPSTLALAGAAILSRHPLGRVENVDLPELRDKFSSKREKRLGKKRALLAEIRVPAGDGAGDIRPLVCATCHLDSNASPRQRAAQLDALLTRASQLAAEVGSEDGVPQTPGILVGGDFNSTTYDASGKLALARDLLHKFFLTGFDQTVAGYMWPERTYERPVFETLARHGFVTTGLNDMARGTYAYDVQSPFAVAKLNEKVGSLLTRLLQYMLRKWNGVVPARLDWFAGKGVRGTAATVVEARSADGVPASDHAAIVTDVALGPS